MVLWYCGGERREQSWRGRWEHLSSTSSGLWAQGEQGQVYPLQEGPGKGKNGDCQGSHGRRGRSGKGKVDLLFLSSHFLEEKERNKCHFYKGLPPILAAVVHSLPSLSLTESLHIFTTPGAKSATGFFGCLQQTAVNCCPYKGTALAMLKASSTQAETSTPGSQISVAPPLVQRLTNEEGSFTWLSSNTRIDPIRYFLYWCHKLRVLQTDCKGGKRKQIMKNNEIDLESKQLLQKGNSLLRLSQV